MEKKKSFPLFYSAVKSAVEVAKQHREVVKLLCSTGAALYINWQNATTC